MFDLVSLFNLINKYTINNSNVYLKETNEQVLDNEIISKVKLSYTIYNEARNLYKNELMKLKNVDKNLKDYLKITIEKYCANDEVLDEKLKK